MTTAPSRAGSVDSPTVGGLTTVQAQLVLARHGSNQLPVAARPRLLARVVGQLRDPMIVMLCAAGAVVLAIGDREDATIIAAVVVLNTAIGVVQEIRAQRDSVIRIH